MIYEYGKGTRFALGRRGKNSLVVFGINPSTATDKKFDKTIFRIEKLSKDLGFDSWLMLNIYPQRSTNPNKIHKTLKREFHERNLKVISRILSQLSSYTLCAAWGFNIDKRSYLKVCLRDIVDKAVRSNSWVSLGKTSTNGHPRHPSRLPNSVKLKRFDIESYLSGKD